ncbi:MAG TPA: hypothetical protein VL284_17615, partial [Thermoanaerobaculia bacterium]|nr:hypothetical protein [Thermoanaerobaculia bacterium]
MRTAILFAALLIHPPVITLSSLSRIQEICGGEFEACTRFVAYRLTATCSGTRLEASIEYAPHIFLHDPRKITHEQLHIDDVRRFAA